MSNQIPDLIEEIYSLSWRKYRKFAKSMNKEKCMCMEVEA